MSKLPTATLPPDDDIEPTPEAEVVLETRSLLADVEVQPAPTLITEQEVIFGTAVATLAPATGWWTRAIRVVAVAMGRVFTASEKDPRPKRRHYPPRYDFIEDARMAREMHRL
jgi:hypothetical protein